MLMQITVINTLQKITIPQNSTEHNTSRQAEVAQLIMKFPAFAGHDSLFPCSEEAHSGL
jgi:hypothetical protein